MSFNKIVFPPPDFADEDGLLAFGGNLEIETLLTAYSSGIFPWTVKPITWWSPDPRAIFELDSFKLRKRIKRYMKSGNFRITFDKDFRRVIEGCAVPAPGREDTWISAEFIEAYCNLHTNGYAHSVEVWQKEKLVGGLYGVALGGLFAGESMFSNVSNASTIALGAVINRLKERGFCLFDSQVISPHTKFLGAIEISRSEYLRRLKHALTKKCGFI